MAFFLFPAVAEKQTNKTALHGQSLELIIIQVIFMRGIVFCYLL